MPRGFRMSCWGEDINVRGGGSSNISFSNFGRQIKIIDTMKYFQTSVVQIASTTTPEEKEKIKKLILEFLTRRNLFNFD